MNDLKYSVRQLLNNRGFTAVAVVTLALFVLPTPAPASDFNLGELAKGGKLEVYNRRLQQPKAESQEAVFLDAAPDDGFTWVAGLEFSEGTIEVEIKGKNEQGRSFVGIAFHGLNNGTFDSVYLRPFNFRAGEEIRRSHGIQYVSLPGHDWSELRSSHPGKYESAITPAPDPDSWVKLKVVIKGGTLAAFVNGAEEPALKVKLLNSRPAGKVGLCVGNGSDGWFRNLKITPASK